MYIYLQKWQFRMLTGFPPIFVADTKIIYDYNFVASLTLLRSILRIAISLQERLILPESVLH